MGCSTMKLSGSLCFQAQPNRTLTSALHLISVRLSTNGIAGSESLSTDLRASIHPFTKRVRLCALRSLQEPTVPVPLRSSSVLFQRSSLGVLGSVKRDLFAEAWHAAAYDGPLCQSVRATTHGRRTHEIFTVAPSHGAAIHGGLCPAFTRSCASLGRRSQAVFASQSAALRLRPRVQTSHWISTCCS